MATHLHPGIRAVFFDAVGTLIAPDPPAEEVYAAAARAGGSAAAAAAIRGRFRAAFRAEEEADRAAGWATGEAREVSRWRRIVAAAVPDLADPEAGFRRLYDHFARPAAWRTDPAAAGTLRHLAGLGLALGIASNFDHRLRGVAAGLADLAPARGAVVVSSEVGFRKPAGAFFRAVVAAAGCAAGEIVFVGDDPENDYEGAAAAGLSAVLLDPADRYPGAARRVKSLADLLA